MKTSRLGFFRALLLVLNCLVSWRAAGQETEVFSQGGEAIRGGDTSWNLVWDDKVDDTLDSNAKSCRLRLSVGGGEVTGRFDGPVLGVPRDARFTGSIIRSNHTSLLLLRQEEGDYTCVYQIQVREDGRLFGVWQDTLGRKGDVELRRVDT